MFLIILISMLSWLNTSAGTFDVSKNISLKKNIVVRKPAINNTLLNNLVSEEILLQKNNFLNQALKEEKKDILSFYVEGTSFDTENYESVYLFFETYLDGAHPTHFVKTFVVDKRTSKIITLDDFINLDEKFLQKVSDSIRMDLLLSLEVTDTTWMMEGTRPFKENYQNFVIKENEILFIFQEYQIAPYARGIIKCSYSYQIA